LCLQVRTGIERTILSVKRRVENHINGRHPFPTKRVKSTKEQAAEDEAGTGGGLEAKYEIYYTSAENETPRAISKIAKVLHCANCSGLNWARFRPHGS